MLLISLIEQIPTNWINDLPIITLIVGACTALAYGVKAGTHLWGRWIAWDNHRTQEEIKKVFGTYDKEKLDKAIQDLCNKIADKTQGKDYASMRDDLNKLIGAVDVITKRGQYHSV